MTHRDGNRHIQNAVAAQTTAGSQPILGGNVNQAQVEPIAIIVQASCLTRSGIARRARQPRTIGPKRGCASSQRSQRSLPRAKQKAASSTKGVVGSSGRKMPIIPVTNASAPAATQNARCHSGRRRGTGGVDMPPMLIASRSAPSTDTAVPR